MRSVDSGASWRARALAFIDGERGAAFVRAAIAISAAFPWIARHARDAALLGGLLLFLGLVIPGLGLLAYLAVRSAIAAARITDLLLFSTPREVLRRRVGAVAAFFLAFALEAGFIWATVTILR